jgi:hypothetical protein
MMQDGIKLILMAWQPGILKNLIFEKSLTYGIKGII